MGYRISVSGPSPYVFGKLTANPSALFSEPYAGYLLFLFNDVDRDVERWFLDNTVSLDALTGTDVAFAFVTHRLHYRFHTDMRSGESRSNSGRQFECSAEEAANDFSVV